MLKTDQTNSWGSRACISGRATAWIKVIHPIRCACACLDSSHAISHSVSLCLLCPSVCLLCESDPAVAAATRC